MAVSSLSEKYTHLTDDFVKWAIGRDFVNILFTGRTGAGKSSLINGITGKDVATEGDSLDPETLEVAKYSFEYNDVKITVWDSPGLQDGTGNEQKYIEDMQNKGCASSDLFLYCTKMDDTRFAKEENDAIRKITIGLSQQMWENAVFVLTYANRVEKNYRSKPIPEDKTKQDKEYFKYRMAEFDAKLRKAVVNAGVDEKVAAMIPVVPTGYDTEQGLPDRDNWLSPLWYVSILRMKEKSQPALLKANINRIKLPEQIKPEDFKKPLHEQPIIFMPVPVKYGTPPAILSLLGGMIGAMGGPVGVAVGVTTGAAVGVAADVIIAYFSNGGRSDDQEESKP